MIWQGPFWFFEHIHPACSNELLSVWGADFYHSIIERMMVLVFPPSLYSASYSMTEEALLLLLLLLSRAISNISSHSLPRRVTQCYRTTFIR